MRRTLLTLTIATAAAMTAAAASAQTSTSPTGPAFSTRFFTTALENDPSRVVQMQMQLHLPNRPGNGFHTHNGDQWEAVVEGEITFTVKGQPPRLLKTGEYVYIPRHGPSQREQEQSAGAHHGTADPGQGQAAEQPGPLRRRAAIERGPLASRRPCRRRANAVQRFREANRMSYQVAED
jgi:quercetin dioxygenase-like cupin family protein